MVAGEPLGKELAVQTIVLEEPGRLMLAETAEPARPGVGEALVAVWAVGICGTDIHAFAGRQPFFSYPRILGHELGVEVLSVGAGVTHVGAGDRCAVEPYLSCGACHACVVGRMNCCVAMKVLGVQTDGGMREQIVVPAKLLHPPASPPEAEALSYEALALVEMLGIGCHAVHRAQVEAGETAAVIGLGPIGLAAAQFALLAGAKVVGVDVSEHRASQAREVLGIETLVLGTGAGAARLSEQWRSAYGSLPTQVFDATGNKRSMEAAFELPEHAGNLTFISLVLGEIAFDDPNFHRRELTVRSSRNALPGEFAEILGHMAAGRIEAERWITHRVDAAALPGKFAAMIKPEAGMLKGVVRFGL